MGRLDQDSMISLVVFGSLDAVSLCVLLLGLALGLRAWLRSKRLRRTTGEVVEHQRYESHIGSSRRRMPTTLLKPVFRFEVRGETHTLVGRIGSSMPPAIGSAVRLAYDPADPASAEIDAPLARYLTPVVLSAFGLLLVVLFTAVGLAAIH